MAEQRRLDASDVPAAADLLARAFRDNPAMIAIVGHQPETRLALLRRFMALTLRLHRKYGECWGAFDDGVLRAAMVSSPPGGYPLPFRADVAYFWTAIRHAGPAVTLRFARVDRTVRRQHVRSPHHYVFFLGTDPAWQGRGLGSLLLRGLSQRAAGHACYLETDRLTSVKLYERHGYRVVHHERAAVGEGFPLWFMLRAGATR